MRFANSLRFVAVLCAFVVLGCGDGADNGAVQPVSLNELIGEAHFLAKELHFNMQSGVEHQFNISVFESLQLQLENLKTKAADSDVSRDQKRKLVKACDSLIETFGRVTGGSAEYQKSFSAVDAELSRQVQILEQMK